MGSHKRGNPKRCPEMESPHNTVLEQQPRFLTRALDIATHHLKQFQLLGLRGKKKKGNQYTFGISLLIAEKGILMVQINLHQSEGASTVLRDLTAIHVRIRNEETRDVYGLGLCPERR